jgi:hypothetical protein
MPEKSKNSIGLQLMGMHVHQKHALDTVLIEQSLRHPDNYA